MGNGPDPHGRPGVVFLDEDHAYIPMTTADGHWYAISETHRTPRGTWCWGTVDFTRATGPGPKWTVISEQPLTITPSIRCDECGEHYYLEGGRCRPIGPRPAVTQ